MQIPVMWIRWNSAKLIRSPGDMFSSVVKHFWLNTHYARLYFDGIHWSRESRGFRLLRAYRNLYVGVKSIINFYIDKRFMRSSSQHYLTTSRLHAFSRLFIYLFIYCIKCRVPINISISFHLNKSYFATTRTIVCQDCHVAGVMSSFINSMMNIERQTNVD